MTRLMHTTFEVIMAVKIRPQDGGSWVLLCVGILPQNYTVSQRTRHRLECLLWTGIHGSVFTFTSL